MKNTGKTFEKSIEEVFNFMYANYPEATIDRDVWLDSPYGKRQFDVVITIKIPDDKLIIVIEGKDYNKNLDVPVLDGFHSKMHDVKASKGIIVSKKGFSSKARQKAKQLGITLYSLNDHSTFSEFDLKVPVLIEAISPRTLDIIFTVEREVLSKAPKMYFNSEIIINNENVSEIINRTWIDGTLIFDLDEEEQSLEIPLISSPYKLKFFTHETLNITSDLEITNVKLNMTLNYSYYLCDVRDILHNKALKNLEQDTIHFFVDTHSLSDALKDLKPISLNRAKGFTGVDYVIKIKNTAKIEFNEVKALL